MTLNNMATVANAGGFRSGGSATILAPESGPYGLGMSDRLKAHPSDGTSDTAALSHSRSIELEVARVMV